MVAYLLYLLPLFRYVYLLIIPHWPCSLFGEIIILRIELNHFFVFIQLGTYTGLYLSPVRLCPNGYSYFCSFSEKVKGFMFPCFLSGKKGDNCESSHGLSIFSRWVLRNLALSPGNQLINAPTSNDIIDMIEYII